MNAIDADMDGGISF